MARKSAPVKKTKKTSAKSASPAVVEEKTPASTIEIKKDTVKKALDALSKWNAKRTAESEKQNLLADDDEDLPLILQVSAGKFFADNKMIHVEQMELPHSVLGQDLRVCVIAKDGTITPEIVDQIEDRGLPHFKKVISVSELKTTYRPYQSRRRLLSEYDVFLVDNNVISLMPKLLGKIFYQSSKLPRTIRFTPEYKFDMAAFEDAYKGALRTMAFMLPMGNTMVMRMGYLGQGAESLYDNLAVVCQFLSKFQIRSLQLKLADSPSLPLYMVDKIYTDADVAADEAALAELTALENQRLALEEEKSNAIFQAGLKELGFEEESSKRPADQAEHSKSAKKPRNE